MKRMLGSLLVALFLFAAFDVFAEQAIPPAPTGFFGVYLGGAKVGFCAWSIEQKEVGKEKYYRFAISEERTSGDKKDTLSHNGTVNLDLSARTLDSTETRSGRTSTIKAKRVGNNISVTVQFKGSTAMPERRIAVPIDCTWSCFAPFAFAWRLPEVGKAAKMNYIFESGGQVVSVALTAKTFTKEFQDNKITVSEWLSESLHVMILTDTEGNLLTYTEKSKAGVVTSYISEPEDIAKSQYSFDEYKTKAKEQPGKKQAKTKKRATTEDEVEGDNNGIFKEYFQPVSEDAEDSESGDYMKVNKCFSMQIADKWTASVGLRLPRITDYCIKCDQYPDAKIRICCSKITYTFEPIDHHTYEGIECASLSYLLLFHLMAAFEYATNPPPEDVVLCKRFKFSDGNYLYGREFDMDSNIKKKGFGVIAQNNHYTIFAAGFAPVEDWETYSDTIFCMLGSLRALEDEKMSKDERDALKDITEDD